MPGLLGLVVAASGSHPEIACEHSDGRLSRLLVRNERDRLGRRGMLPDEEATVTVHAAGFVAQPVAVKLPEGAAKEVELVLRQRAQHHC